MESFIQTMACLRFLGCSVDPIGLHFTEFCGAVYTNSLLPSNRLPASIASFSPLYNYYKPPCSRNRRGNPVKCISQLEVSTLALGEQLQKPVLLRCAVPKQGPLQVPTDHSISRPRMVPGRHPAQ